MDCTRCGHPYPCHRLGPELKCRMRIPYGWDEKTRSFAHTAPCRCPGFRVRECPHEYVTWAPTCVHCGHVVATEKKAT